MQLLPSIPEQALVCPLPSRGVPATASHRLLVNELINMRVKGKLLRARLWLLMCHLGSCRREVLVTLRKNELELSEANKT